MIDLFGDKIIQCKDIPRRTDVKTVQKYGTYKHDLYEQQEGYCNGGKTHFPFRNLTVDHKTPQSKGGTDHVENLQLLCGSCNSVKGDRDMPYLMAALQQQDTKVRVSATRISQM